MSRSFESVQWNACAHKLDLGLYSHPKEFRGNGVRTHVNSRKKISTGKQFSPHEDRTHDAASKHYQRVTPASLYYFSPTFATAAAITTTSCAAAAAACWQARCFCCGFDDADHSDYRCHLNAQVSGSSCKHYLIPLSGAHGRTCRNFTWVESMLL